MLSVTVKSILLSVIILSVVASEHLQKFLRTTYEHRNNFSTKQHILVQNISEQYAAVATS